MRRDTQTRDLLTATVEEPRFDGETYDPMLDRDRLAKQLGRVFDALRAHQWLTLRELSGITRDPESSISARIRDLRKERFGGHTILRRRRDVPARGIFEYRLQG